MAEYIHAVGGRKNAVARVFLREGSGKIFVNGIPYEDYFGKIYPEVYVRLPFEITKTSGKFDVKANITGGGKSAQMQALVHGIAKALVQYNSSFQSSLKAAGFLSRDPRKKERKKYGQPGRRKKYQYSKR
jgi:small subunit ribosomal protein S9